MGIMRQVAGSVVVLIAAAAHLGIAQPTTGTGEEPCFQISKLWTASKAASKHSSVTVPAALAYACLVSVPLEKQNALDLIESIRPYLEWQSDAAYKLSPPSDYAFAGYDIFGNLATVKSKLADDGYSNEYEFQKDLYETVFAAGHDAHMHLHPDLLSRATRFRRTHALVSVSNDGSALPVIKVYDDIGHGVKASTVTHIDGVSAVDFLSDYVRKYSISQDFDAGYNALFYQKAQYVYSKSMGDFASGGGGSLIYQGDNTTLTFANGTSVTTDNYAQLRGDWTGIIDGRSFYTKFCSPAVSKPNDSGPSMTVNGRLPGYPIPIIISDDGIVSGYYLREKEHEDVAVLSLLSFEPNDITNFVDVVEKFLSMARKAGKTKLILDLQANPGGYVLLGHDLFGQLFPNIVQNGYSRWKESDSLIYVARTYSEEVSAAIASDNITEDVIRDYFTSLPFQADLNLTNGHFETFEDKFAPSIYMKTNYTQIIRDEVLHPSIHGYGNLRGMIQPFASDNIVLLYDGYCASTCTLASEMLRSQGGVKSITFGGRPQAGPMQGVGGVKGVQMLSFADINRYVQRAAALTTDAARHKEFARFNDLAVTRSITAGVNVRDQILQSNIQDGLPAQYVYEAADCRMYWDESMLEDVSQIWKAAANAAFMNATCADGGIIRPSVSRRATAQDEDSKASLTAAVRANNRSAGSPSVTTDPDWLAKQLQKVNSVF